MVLQTQVGPTLYSLSYGRYISYYRSTLRYLKISTDVVNTESVFMQYKKHFIGINSKEKSAMVFIIIKILTIDKCFMYYVFCPKK